jgi:hypothetical protein
MSSPQSIDAGIGASVLATPLHSLASMVMGTLEWVVESRRGDRLETWYVMVPDRALADQYQALGVQLTPGCRVVVDAGSLRPVGVLPAACAETPPAACGYNPYRDVNPA